jgi:hypothetical protein
MPAFLIPAIAGALLSVAASLVGRIIVALGMGLVAYSGINTALSYFQTTFTNAMGGAGATLAGMCGVLQLDTCLAIFTAAALAKLAIAGASSGTIKRLAIK